MSSPCCRPTPAPPLRHLEALTSVYAALADQTRLRILALLRHGEVCVCHIHASLGVPQPTASRHLAYLRRAGLVAARRDGIWMHYSLAPPSNPVIAHVLGAAIHALGHTDAAAKDHQRLRLELAAG